MTPQMKVFQTAAKRAGGRTFQIDDEVYRIAPVGLGIADLIGELSGALPNGEDGGAVPTADELLAKVHPFVDERDWPKFDDYVRRYVAPGEYAEIVRWLIGEVTGRNPIRPASSPDGSSVNGKPSPAGAAATASSTPSRSRSTKASTPTSTRSASGRTKTSSKK